MKPQRLLPALMIGLGLALVLMAALSRPSTSRASPDAAIRYVAATGDDASPTCNNYSLPCHTVQHAVDVATLGDEIHVATGIYTDVQMRAGVTQTVYISKSVTIRGGYTTTNWWTPPDPVANPTMLDAQGKGRVLYLTGNITPTIEGLRLTGGAASEGGGVYVVTATAILKNNQVFSNTARSHGGGLFLSQSNAVLGSNIVSSNRAGSGGGLYLDSSPATLSGNTVFSNFASTSGGGMYLVSSPAMLNGNTVFSNTTWGNGGGLLLSGSNARLYANTIISNAVPYGQYGGGVYLSGSSAILDGNIIASNAAGYGGGLYLESSPATLTNTVVADNQSIQRGSGLYVYRSASRLLHTTLARNRGGDGSGVYIVSTLSVVTMTNSIVVSQTVGITVTSGSTATLNGVLWYSNTANTGGLGAVTMANAVTGDPAFAADGYHLTPVSAAIDQGVDAGVIADIDGDPRPVAGGPDLGADEFTCYVRLNDNATLYDSVQAAIDASTQPADVVKVAGICTGVQARAGVTQTVYLSKTLTIRGGYRPDFAAWNPQAYPTTLDARGKGRVLYIGGDISPRVEDVRITGGNAAGQGGNPWSEDSGGGVYIITATAILSGCQVTSNTAQYGGGLYLSRSDSTLQGNTFASNRTAEDGGGVYLSYSGATLNGNTVTSNTATSHGGGVYLDESDATFTANRVTSNTARYDGGGLYVFGGAWSPASLNGNAILANTAGDDGGGLYLYETGPRLTNNLIADNRAGTAGSGLYIYASSAQMLHTTIARNAGGDGSGIYVTAYAQYPYGTVALTNTILVSHTVGITVTAGNTVTLQGTVWGSGAWANQRDWGGPGQVITGAANIWGNPAFVDASAGDYHIGSTSVAHDTGVDSGVHQDMDGQMRPMGWGYDIGADEYAGAGLAIAQQPSMVFLNPSQAFTYTTVVTSAGTANATGVVLTDTLDGWQKPLSAVPSVGNCSVAGGWGGDVVCSLGTLVTGATATVKLTAQVSPTLSPDQAMVNTVVARSNETANRNQATTYGQDCHARINESSTEYTTVQAAVDAASPGDLVKVAGMCLGASQRAGGRQQVYLDKPLTLRGGYSVTNWTAADPHTQPTTLDALGQGRVLYVTGNIRPTIEGLRITGGDPWGYSAGGGVYIITATATLCDCQIYSNTAGSGGGLYLGSSPATLSRNIISGNNAAVGGGLFLYHSAARLNYNTIISNGPALGGGGLVLDESPATLDGDAILSNTASDGGGLLLDHSDATLINIVVADNLGRYGGSGASIYGSSPRLLHATFARNRGVDGSGVYVTDDGEGIYSAVATTNTILVSQTVGITVTAGNTATLNGVLWYSNTTNYGGPGTITVANAITGDPAFATDGYHLTAASKAIDAGVEAGVTADIDGDSRDAWPDLGADEYPRVHTCWARLNNTSTDYATVQAAVDASTQPADVVKVAGYCAGVEAREGTTQTVYLSKTLTIRGGYRPDFAAWNPQAYPTTLDARGQGRVLYINGDISPTIEELHITGGNALGLCGSSWKDDAGGGVCVATATTTLSNCQIFSNTARHGGGVALWSSPATLNANVVSSNTAQYNGGGLNLTNSPATLNANVVFGNAVVLDGSSGGGLYLDNSAAMLYTNIIASNISLNEGGGLALIDSTATLYGNTITSNTASSTSGGLKLIRSAATLISNTVTANKTNRYGGGLSLYQSPATLNSNLVTSNTAQYGGGGLYLLQSPATLNSNLVTSNTAQYDGGGLSLYQSSATLNSNLVTSNTARYGGGLYLSTSNATLANTVLANNRTSTAGNGLYIRGSSPRLWHNTFARNTGGDGSGIYVTNYGENAFSTVALTNTILVSQTVGITVTAGSTSTLNGVLWYGNTANTGGPGAITVANAITGDPAFAADGYHLTAASKAIDAGVNAGVAADIDGEPRPQGNGYDLGADEFPSALSAPGVPLLIAPPNGTVTTTPAITLAWQAGAGATPTRYNVQLDGAVVTTAKTTSATVLSAGVHTWSVRAYNTLGYSDWAAPWTVELESIAPCTTLTSVDLSGPTTGLTGTAYIFTATVSPPEVTLPITYTWHAMQQNDVTQVGPFTQITISFIWNLTGTKSVTATAVNCAGDPVGDTQFITVKAIEMGGMQWIVYLPLVLRNP